MVALGGIPGAFFFFAGSSMGIPQRSSRVSCTCLLYTSLSGVEVTVTHDKLIVVGVEIPALRFVFRMVLRLVAIQLSLIHIWRM